MVNYICYTIENAPEVKQWMEERGLEPLEMLHLSTFIFHDKSFTHDLMNAAGMIPGAKEMRTTHVEIGFHEDALIVRIDWPALDSLMEEFYSSSEMFQGHPEYTGEEKVEDNVRERRRPHVTIYKGRCGDVDLSLGPLEKWVPKITGVMAQTKADGANVHEQCEFSE